MVALEVPVLSFFPSLCFPHQSGKIMHNYVIHNNKTRFVYKACSVVVGVSFVVMVVRELFLCSFFLDFYCHIVVILIPFRFLMRIGHETRKPHHQPTTLQETSARVAAILLFYFTTVNVLGQTEREKKILIPVTLLMEQHPCTWRLVCVCPYLSHRIACESERGCWSVPEKGRENGK